MYKVVVCGAFGIGKTSLIVRKIRNWFSYDSPTTVGALFMSWRPDTDSRMNFGIWDTAGQERFSTLLPLYLRGAHAVFLCWDATVAFDPLSANIMLKQATDINPNVHAYLVFTKMDIGHKSKSAEQWVMDNGLRGLFYTSAQNGSGIDELFEAMANGMATDPPPKPKPNPEIVLQSSNKQRYCC